MFLTHTGIVNEAGITMENTVGKYAYRFICIPLEHDCTLALLCSDSLQFEDISEFINFEMSQKDFI